MIILTKVKYEDWEAGTKLRVYGYDSYGKVKVHTFGSYSRAKEVPSDFVINYCEELEDSEENWGNLIRGVEVKNT